jgi:hypothetical protein
VCVYVLSDWLFLQLDAAKNISGEGKGSKVAPSQDEADMDELNALDTMDMLEQMNKPNLPKTDSFKLDSTKPQSMLHVKREFKRFLSEFGIYMTWMLTFAFTILLTRDNTMTFQFADLFRKALLTDAGWDEGITTVDNFWDFLLQDAGMILANDLFTRQDDNFFAAESSFLYGNRRVGALRLRQVRVPPARCSSFYITRLLANEPETEEKKSIACYPAFNSGDKLEKTFKKEGDFQVIDTDAQPWFKFWTSKELNEMGSFSATFNSYPGSGFFIDVNDAWWNEAGDDCEPPPTPTPVTPLCRLCFYPRAGTLLTNRASRRCRSAHGDQSDGRRPHEAAPDQYHDIAAQGEQLDRSQDSSRLL